MTALRRSLTRLRFRPPTHSVQVLPTAEAAVLRAYQAAGVRAATIGKATPAKRVLIKCQAKPAQLEAVGREYLASP